MPIAALFATTMVYGRLAADNELQACRAAGINIHCLFLSTVLLSVFVAALASPARASRIPAAIGAMVCLRMSRPRLMLVWFACAPHSPPGRT